MYLLSEQMDSDKLAAIKLSIQYISTLSIVSYFVLGSNLNRFTLLFPLFNFIKVKEKLVMY